MTDASVTKVKFGGWTRRRTAVQQHRPTMLKGAAGTLADGGPSRNSLLALISASLVFVQGFTARHRSTAIVSFIGYTNAIFQNIPRRAPTAETCASFRLVNATGRRLVYRAESIETWTPTTGWQTTALRCTPTNWYGFGAALASGETCVFHVPPPVADRWRVRLTCTEKATGLRRAKDWVADYKSNRNPANATRGVTGETFSGFVYQIVSPEVQP